MVIGYNENVFVTDYSNCASVMEAAVNLFQEMKIEENFIYSFINESVLNEAVDVKVIKKKMSEFLKSWLSKIIAIISKIRSFILEKMANFKKKEKTSDKTESVNSSVKFSISSYDYSKITVSVLSNFNIIEWKSDDGNFPTYATDSNYQSFIKSKIKEWTGQDDLSATSNQIIEHISKKYCGDKIIITEKMDAYSKSNVSKWLDSNEFDGFLSDLTKRAKRLQNSLDSSIDFIKHQTQNSQNSDSEFKKLLESRIVAAMRYLNLNTLLISGLSGIITKKMYLYNDIYNKYN